MNKTCSDCKIPQPKKHFYADKRSKDGLAAYCRSCVRKRLKKWCSTPRGKATSAWRLMNRRVVVQSEYAGIEVRMTRVAFLEWAIPQYAKWISESTPGVPTIDRIDPDGHYELSNIRLLSWRDNALRARRNRNIHAPAGQRWCCRCKAYLPLSSFGKSKNETHGVTTMCKLCRVAVTPHRHHPRWRNDTAPAGMRWCCRCVTLQCESAFYTCRVHGFQSACKACQNKPRQRHKLS